MLKSVRSTMPSLLAQLLLCTASVRALWIDAKGWRDFADGSDLTHFITRPEFKAPRYMVAKHHPEAISPGYWFVTPYTHVGATPTTGGKDYVACSNGAHIYDSEGELVWSGSCLCDNRNVFNFRPIDINGSTFFSFFLPGDDQGFNLAPDKRLPAGVLMNNQFQEVSKTRPNGAVLDGHEFRILPGGQTTLLSTFSLIDADASILGQRGLRKVINTGFEEEETGTSNPLFQWDPISYGVMMNESCDTTEKASPASHGRAWDFFHINSIDKFANGDYLVSGRHMSTIYRISRVDGRILWRLGGCYAGISDFEMEDGVPFFWQHHARVRSENATHIIISLFDNASEDLDRGFAKGHSPPVGKVWISVLISTFLAVMRCPLSSKCSAKDQGQSVYTDPNGLKSPKSALLVSFNYTFANHMPNAFQVVILDISSRPMTAKMLRRFDRPEGGQSPALGSLSVIGEDVQTANIFIDWGFDGYISEYDGNGRLLLEARFISDRMRSYRAYKLPFKGEPIEPPVLKVLPIGYSDDEAASAFYVSWNGATEVASWAFYGGDTEDFASFKPLAIVKRRGFETSWVTPGVIKYAYAEAFDGSGSSIGFSSMANIVPRFDAHYELFSPSLQDIKIPQPSQLQGPPPALKETSPVGAGHIQIQQEKGREKSHVPDGAPPIVIYSFAAYGFYTAVRSLYRLKIRKRKGYQTIPAYVDVGSR